MQLINQNQQFALQVLQCRINKFFNDFSKSCNRLAPQQMIGIVDVWLKDPTSMCFQIKQHKKVLAFVSLDHVDQEVATLEVFIKQEDDFEYCLTRLKQILNYGFSLLNLKRIKLVVGLNDLRLKECLDQGVYGFTRWGKSKDEFVYDLSKVEFLNEG